MKRKNEFNNTRLQKRRVVTVRQNEDFAIEDIESLGNGYPNNRSRGNDPSVLVIESEDISDQSAKSIANEPLSIQAIKTLVNDSSGDKEKIFDSFIKQSNFGPLICSLRNELYSKIIYVLAEIANIFPEHHQQLSELVMQPANLKSLFPSLADMYCLLGGPFYLKEEELIEIILNDSNINYFIQTPEDVKELTQSFPAYQDEIYQIITQPQHLKRLLKNDRDLGILKLVYPQLSTFVEKVYNQGAATGMFGCQLPVDVSKHIGSFFDKKTGGRVAQTNKDAAREAKESKEEFYQRPNATCYP